MTVICLIPWWLARSSRRSDFTVLSSGLALEVFVCLIISTFAQQESMSNWQHVSATTWILPLIVLFPLVVPMPPGRTLLVASASALMSPVGLLLASLMPSSIHLSVADYAEVIREPAIAVVLALLSSQIVYNLGLQISKARRLGSYQLEERLGAGGMGEVWRASHMLLARPAAVKLIRPEVFQEFGPAKAHEAMARFEREAQATAGLSSPHTIEVYDFGITDEGSFYYVMELLEGFDLRSLVEKYGPVPAERAVHFLRQACHSLWDAHRQGLAHRDVKPANLFVGVRGPDYDFVKVLDFGLVKESSVGREGAQPTMEGAMTGTPAYMAPEMVRGDRSGDERSDLYSLGCVAFWLLTGRLVFEADTPMAMVLKHVQDDPLPPSQCTELAVPSELDRVVLDCLAKNPSDRPKSAKDLIDRLDACATSLEEWTPSRAASWWDLHAPDLT
jgi:serine/threonine protein kinase